MLHSENCGCQKPKVTIESVNQSTSDCFAGFVWLFSLLISFTFENK